MKRNTLRTIGCGLVMTAATIAAAGDLPEYGVHVPELDIFDTVMQAYMESNGINAGVLAVSVDGVVVYQRGFGNNIPENTPVRLASVEKPIVSAAIRQLINDGLIDWNDFVFDLGQPGGGILPHQPWNGLGDPRLPDITVVDLMMHQGGWDRDTAEGLGSNGDPQFFTLQMAEAMGVDPPADINEIISYMLSEPLQFTPGTNGCTNAQGSTFCYSNFGFMVLGQIVEEVSGMSLQNYVYTHVLTTDMWVPKQEIFRGRTFQVHQDPREPVYQCGGSCNCTNVFEPGGPGVPCPYGNWHHEAFKGHGNMVASVGPLLAYMDKYVVAVQANQNGGAGMPLPTGDFNGQAFAGALIGASTVMWQRGDGINIAVLFTHWGGVNHGVLMADLISDIIDAQNFDFSQMKSVDGFWTDFSASGDVVEVGGYHHPFRTMQQALGVGAGAKVRLKPGSTSWTGTISHRMSMDAPLGTTVIGVQ